MQITTRNNIVLGTILVLLCFMIKCKLDSDVVANSSTGADATRTAGEKNVNTNEVVSIKETDENAPLQNVHGVEDANGEVVQADEDVPAQDEIDGTRTSETKSTEADKSIVGKNKAQSQSDLKNEVEKLTIKSVAKIEFEELFWDFGEITEGDIVKRDFVFRNVGNKPLQIIGADASCGCARPTVPFLDIAPGESSKIGITYNSVSKQGEQFPEIIIESNTIPKHSVIKLKGIVKKKAEKRELDNNIDSSKIDQDTIPGKG